MSYSVDIADGLDFSVIPVEGIIIETRQNGVYLSKDEALGLASAIIKAYSCYLLNSEGKSDVTLDELMKVFQGNYFSKYHNCGL